MALSRDARLLARVRGGDDAAFEELHARHQPAILSFCRHLTGSREDAEDAVQHTFLGLYRRIVESSAPLELRPWLFAVARNRCLSLLRARRERPLGPDSALAALDGLAAEVERREELRDLVRDMARLPEPQRAALILSQLDALSYREIATAMELTAEQVKALVFQARSSLASTREARDAPCLEIRRQIADARGAGLRRRLLRRHVGECAGCREFESAVRSQRRGLAILLPVAPTAGIGDGLLGGTLGREGATAAAGAGAATAGGGGAGLAGLVGTLGAGGAGKLAVVAAVGGIGVATVGGLPPRVEDSGPTAASRAAEASAGRPPHRASEIQPEAVVGAREREAGARPGARPGRAPIGVGGRRAIERAATGMGPAHGRPAEVGPPVRGDGAPGGGGAPSGDPSSEPAPPRQVDEPRPPQPEGRAEPPPGLERRAELPPRGREELPPGLERRTPSTPAAQDQVSLPALERRATPPPGLTGDQSPGRSGEAPGRSGEAPGRSGQAPPADPPGAGPAPGEERGDGGGRGAGAGGNGKGDEPR